MRLGDNSGPTPAWLYGEAPFPVYRMRLGESLDATLTNRLKEHTSIHWHGVRGPNAMDGVPYVTQLPVQPGESFAYRFTPPDAGTYFFHPHCDTAAQLGRGLAGVLIVDDESAPFDDDIVCVLKDWRVAKDGSFLPFVTTEGAGRGGTFGTLRTVNGLAAPEISVPAGANIRLRVLNVDSTRVSDIGVQGAQGLDHRHRRQSARALRAGHVAAGPRHAHGYRAAHPASGRQNRAHRLFRSRARNACDAGRARRAQARRRFRARRFDGAQTRRTGPRQCGTPRIEAVRLRGGDELCRSHIHSACRWPPNRSSGFALLHRADSSGPSTARPGRKWDTKTCRRL